MDVQEKTGKFTGKEAGALLLTLAAALSLWLFIAAHHRKTAIEDISKSLETINSYKTAEITAWLDDHRREALRLSSHPFLGEIISAELSTPGARRSSLAAWLKDHAEQKRYAGMAFLSLKGRIIAATPGFVSETEKTFAEAFSLASQKGTPQFTDLHLASDAKPHMAIFSPIPAGGRGGKPLSVLIIQINPEDRFYPILKASPLFFAHAETLLVRKEGEKALFLNPLDHRKDSALKFTRPISEEHLPAAAALRGVTGFFTGIDYRGVKVFSAIGPVPGTDWAVITKVDRDTVIAPAKSEEHLYLSLILLGAALLYFLVYAIIRARHHAAEAALAKSRQLLAETEKIGKVGGWEFDIATNELTCTEEVARIHEVEPGYKFDIKKDTGFYTPESRPLIERAMRRAIETGENFDLELEIVTAKGNTRAVHTSGRADPGKRKIYGFFQDITERRKIERKLLETERIFTEFMEHSPIYVFFKDDRIRATRLSRNYESLLGRPLGELLGKSMDDLFPSELAKSMVADDKRILREGKEIVVEEEFNGRSYRTIKFPITVEGKPPYLAGYTIDITEQKQAEEKLRRSEERLRITLEETQIGTWDWDVVNDTWEASPTYFTMLGYEAEPGPSDRKAWLARAHPDDKDMVAGKIRGVLNGSDSKYQYEARIRHADGTYRWQAILGKTVKRDKNGRPGRIIGVRMDITKRKEAEDALRKSEERYREAVELAVDGFLLGSPEGIITGANSMMQKLAGRPLDKLIGLDVSGLFDPDELKASPLRFDLLNESQTVVNERNLLRPDGTSLPIEMHSKKMPDGTYQSIYRDVTERRRVERERLDHLRLLESMDHINRAIQGADKLEKMMSEVLKAVLKIFDCDRAWLFYPCDPDAPSFRVPMEITKPEYPGAGILNVDIPTPPDMAKNLREALESAEPVTYTAGTGKPVNKVSAEQFGVKSMMMAALYPKSGKPWAFGIHQCSHPRVWTPEEIRLMKEIGRRLTDSLTSLLSHRNLQESEHSLKEAQKIASLGSYSFDIAGGTWESSPELDRIFGIENGNYPKDFKGWLEIIHPDERAAMQAYVMDHVVAEKQNFNRQYRIVRAGDRTERWVHGRGELSTDAAGNAATLKGVIQDISEVKQAGLELERLNRDLIAKRQEMENFLYITSHDLRTPLVNIQGFAQNLERYLLELRDNLAAVQLPQPVNEAVSKLTDKELPGALKFVLESSRKMDSLISSLLKVARLGRVEMKTQALEMNDLLKKIVAATRYQLEEAGASVKVGILPPCKADPTAVSQLFANLLENAIKYRAEGRPLAVSITGEARGASVLYKVADNGSGIAAKDLGRIWDIFYRGSAARSGEGEGIGLTVVKYMAEKNGGSIKAESEEGRGTVFCVELPAAGGNK